MSRNISTFKRRKEKENLAPERIPVGCKLVFNGNVLYCAIENNFEANLTRCIKAIQQLTGFEITLDQIIDLDGKCERYTER